MLPDTLHKLPRDERFAYARLLAYMARVDNEITVEELAMFEQRIGTALLSPSQRDELRLALKNPPTLEECLEGLGPESGRLALRDALLMATADGSIDGDEFDVLQEIADHLGLAENAVNELIDWAKIGYRWMEDGIELLNKLQQG
jgi:hypothetical protein